MLLICFSRQPTRRRLRDLPDACIKTLKLAVVINPPPPPPPQTRRCYQPHPPHCSGLKPMLWKKARMAAAACTLGASRRSSTRGCRREGEGSGSSGRTGWRLRGARPTGRPQGRLPSLPGSSTSARLPSSAAGRWCLVQAVTRVLVPRRCVCTCRGRWVLAHPALPIVFGKRLSPTPLCFVHLGQRC